MNDNKKFWQRFAKLYSPFMEKGNGKMYDEICAEISAKLHPNMTVLELACGSGTGFMLRTKMLELAGFHVFSKWTAKEFPLYVRSFQFAITDTKQMGSNIAPLMYLLARKERRELGTFG